MDPELKERIERALEEMLRTIETLKALSHSPQNLKREVELNDLRIERIKR